MEEDRQRVLLSAQPLTLLTNHVKELRKLWQDEAKKNRQLTTVIGKAASLLKRVLASQHETSGVYTLTLQVLKLFEKDDSLEGLRADNLRLDAFGAALHCIKLRSLREAFGSVVDRPHKTVNVEAIKVLILKVKTFAFGKIKALAIWDEAKEAAQADYSERRACETLKVTCGAALQRRLYQAWTSILSTRLKSEPNLTVQIKQMVGALRPLQARTLASAFTTLSLYTLYSKGRLANLQFQALSTKETEVLASFSTRKDEVSFQSFSSPVEFQALRTQKLGALLGRTHTSEKVFIRDSITTNPYATVNPRVINRTLINEFCICQLFRAISAARHRTQCEAFLILRALHFKDEGAVFKVKSAACMVLLSTLSSASSKNLIRSFEAFRQIGTSRPSGFTAAAILIRKELKASLRRRLMDVVAVFRQVDKVGGAFRPKNSVDESFRSKNAMGGSAKLYMSYGRALLHKTLQKFSGLSTAYSHRLASVALYRFKEATKLPSSSRANKPIRARVRKSLAVFGRIVERREVSYAWKVLQLANYRQLLAASLANILDMFHNSTHRYLLATLQKWHQITCKRSSSPEALSNLKRHTANLSPITGSKRLITLTTSVFSRASRSNVSSISYKEANSKILPVPATIHDYIDDIFTVVSQLEDTQFVYSDAFEDSQYRDLSSSFAAQTFSNEGAKQTDSSLSSLRINLRGISKFTGAKERREDLISHQPTASRDNIGSIMRYSSRNSK